MRCGRMVERWRCVSTNLLRLTSVSSSESPRHQCPHKVICILQEGRGIVEQNCSFCSPPLLSSPSSPPPSFPLPFLSSPSSSFHSSLISFPSYLLPLLLPFSPPFLPSSSPSLLPFLPSSSPSLLPFLPSSSPSLLPFLPSSSPPPPFTPLLYPSPPTSSPSSLSSPLSPLPLHS